ncbi:HAD family phosphatase [Cyclobacteriaceae bacterium]|nr:HAD family phosphatase [Cyclobacteriaceae bacterium]MDB4315791.1 HAD family phosphatase [Cyclobacteriaceae bacterium]MDB4603092.1 HAD family phosphatase [Cyclobacteriaceae bacterium]MDB4606090.1 HAD family phosphatase [Cyclobacteriaceae bacterium]MDB9939270.1 HAD family phosphatase [Cyclobacteriaceae bacterium]
MIDLKDTETIIFDLGEVIIDLDSKRVIDQFQKYSDKSAEDIIRLISKSQDLIDYEVGKMTDVEFCQVVNELLSIELSQASFEAIWNSFLGIIKLDKLHLMLALKEKFNVLILSNTNAIHQRAFDRRVGEHIPSKTMADMVHTAYYSHELGLRKPDPHIYQKVIDLQNLNPAKTIFFDDRLENITAAQDSGIQAIQVTYSNQILDQLR